MKVLVTGGAGYIGSTTCSALADAGHTPVILDSLAVGRREFTEGHIFYEGDIADGALVERIVRENPDIECCIHFAARVVVPESVAKPALYYRENVVKSLDLFEALERAGIERILFSSSAALYDVVEGFVVDEGSPLKPMSPYSRTKYMMEMVLQDLCGATGLRGIALRYFNPIGADPGMRTGPYIKNPSHVLGQLLAAAHSEDGVFRVTGVDWPTRDGAGLRDYIHVWDLASAHVKAVERFDAALAASGGARYAAINLGTGRGVTVREFIAAFEEVYEKKLTIVEAPPRPGDIAGACANADLALKLLGWRAEKPLAEGIADAFRWMEIWKDGEPR